MATVTAIRIAASATPTIAVTATQLQSRSQPQFKTLVGINHCAFNSAQKALGAADFWKIPNLQMNQAL